MTRIGSSLIRAYTFGVGTWTPALVLFMRFLHATGTVSDPSPVALACPGPYLRTMRVGIRVRESVAIICLLPPCINTFTAKYFNGLVAGRREGGNRGMGRRKRSAATDWLKLQGIRFHLDIP